MKKVLLIGIAGVYNYGCEAIIRGTVELFRKNSPDYQLFYASINVEDDKKRLEGCDIEIIKRTIKKWTIKNILRKAFGAFGIRIKYCYDSVSILKEIDEVYSIGGDIYTLDSNNNYSASLPLFGEKCISKGVNYYLWGCSVGPFTKNKSAELFFKNHLKKVTKIYAREIETVNYLKSIGIESNVELMVDPAFYVAPEIRKKYQSASIKRIGINLSPLSSKYVYSTIDEAIQAQSQTIKELIDFYNCEILLVPHVWSKHIDDNDFHYLQSIYNYFPEAYQSKIRLISNDPGFLGVKRELINCDVVLAARMHCAINAAAANVLVIFLSYSSKAKGMSQYVYDTTNFVIGLEDFQIDIIKEKISALYSFCNDKENFSPLCK